MDYEFKSQPFEHQHKTWLASRDLKTFAVLWEQGTGKTKLALDTLGHLYLSGEVNGAVIVAPNGVHRNWITDEIPRHLNVPCEALAFKSEAKATKYHAAAVDNLVNAPKSDLALMAISYDAWQTKIGKKAVWDMMRKRICFLVLDESHRIKTPAALRTRSILAGGLHAPYRRILTGTPVTQGPFDIYSQLKFLDADIWRRELDVDTFSAFKAFFGVYEKGWNPNIRNKDGSSGAEFDLLVGYQNLDVLTEILSRYSSRVTKDDVLDLPEKLYTKRYFEMFPAQERIYREIEKEYISWLDSGELITAELAIVRATRLLQVLCGYIPVDGDKEPTELIDRENNPRLKLLRETMEDVNGKTIIWARWTRDIEMIIDTLRSMGRNPVRYDGQLNSDQREASKRAFKEGDATDFVANSMMSEGLTLNEAKTTIYYNNSYRLLDRKQTEDRNHRIGQSDHVTYIDLICEGTKDEHVIDALVTKSEIAAIILGDKK